MVDYIFKQLANTITEILEYFIAGSVGVLSCNMTVFEEAFPIVGTLYAILQGLAMGLILTTIVWQAFKVFGMPLGLEAEDPIRVFLKGIVATFLVFFAKDIILNYAFPIFQGTYNTINDVNSSTWNAFVWTGLNTQTIVSSAADIVALGASAFIKAIITAVCLILIYFNFCKVLLEIVERYILVGVLVYTSPLAFATLPSVTTSNIFKSWMNMVLGQLMMLVLNIWTIKMFFSIMTSPLTNSQFMLWFFLTLGFLKVAQRLDSYMQQIGMSVGTTGNALGGAVLGFMGAQMGSGLLKGAMRGFSKGFGGGFGGAGAAAGGAAGGAAVIAAVSSAGKGIGSPIAGAASKRSSVGGFMNSKWSTIGGAKAVTSGVRKAGVSATNAINTAKRHVGEKTGIGEGLNAQDHIVGKAGRTSSAQAEAIFKGTFNNGSNVPADILSKPKNVSVGNGLVTVSTTEHNGGTTSTATYQLARQDMHNPPGGKMGRDWSVCQDNKGNPYYVTKTSKDAITGNKIINKATPK